MRADPEPQVTPVVLSTGGILQQAGQPVIDVLSGLPLGQMGAGSLLALVIILVVRGDLVPRREVDRRIKEVTSDRDYWRRQVERRDATIDTLVETTRTSAAALAALPAHREE